MHEVSLARAIIGIVREHLDGSDPEDVRRVTVRIGRSAGVVPESLRFAFQALTAEDPLRHAALAIDEIPYRIHCLTCGTDSENSDGIGICAGCGGSDVEILSGTELEVTSMEVS